MFAAWLRRHNTTQVARPTDEQTIEYRVPLVRNAIQAATTQAAINTQQLAEFEEQQRKVKRRTE